MVQPENIFSDLKVVDLARYIAGPSAKTTIADFYVGVIKGNTPETGVPYQYFLCEATESCLRAHPHARNALAPDMTTEASDALDLAASNELVQTVVLTAADFVEERRPNFGSRRTCH
jgi:crotonobetainyl-CoA:carnitine CoA-transferase CaiB-like acyl-CoA transferase